MTIEEAMDWANEANCGTYHTMVLKTLSTEVLQLRGELATAQTWQEHLLKSNAELESERNRYREDRNLEKQMRKQAEGQREDFREALERIIDCTKLDVCKYIANEALKDQP